MIRTGAGIAFLLVIAFGAMMLLMTGSIAERKVDQKLERAVPDLTRAKSTIAAYHREHGVYPIPTEDNALPQEFVTFFAEQRGGQPFYQDQGRYARLDIFAPEKPYGAPLVYYANGNDWLLISRGPDLDIDLKTIDFSSPDFSTKLENISYDPTNGIESSGDLWVRGNSVLLRQ